MPGYLSSIFEPAGDGSGSDQAQQHLGVSDAVDVQEEVGLHTEFSASYQDLDGTTHSWSNSQDLTATVGVHAVLAVAVDTVHDTSEADGL